MKRRSRRSLVAAATASALVAWLVHAPQASADEDVHSPADREVPQVQTWEPGEALKEPEGQDPPEEPWTPEAAGEAGARGDVGARVLACTSENGRGIQGWYPLERHQISDRMELAVNLDSGNAVLRHRDLTVRGTGLDLSVNSFYDSNAWYDSWTLSHGRDVGLEHTSTGVVFHGPSGYCANFGEGEDGAFDRPSGLNATLEELDNGSYAMTFERGEYADQVWLFTADGWLVSQTDRNGNVNRMRYNSDDRLASIVDSQDRVTRFTWDGSDLAAITDPVGETAAAYTYDEDGLVTTLVDRAGQELGFGYDAEGQLTSITDASGAVWELAYNDDGEVSSLSVPAQGAAATTSYAYGDDSTTVTDANGGESSFEFDSQGRQTSATNQVGTTQSQTWTANSDIASTTDALTASVTYDFDEFNNLIGTELPTGASTSVGYADAANPAKPTSVTDPGGDELTFDYDDRGNLTRARSQELDIDVADVAYNGNGTVSAQTDGNGNTTTYDYDDAGNMVRMNEPAPMGSTSYTYDSLSRVTSVSDGNGVTVAYGYDRLDRVVSISHDGQLVQTTEFDGNGNTVATHTAQASTSYAFDGRNALLEAVRTDSSGSETTAYTNDAVGNLTSLTEHGQRTDYAYDAAHRLTTLTDYLGEDTTFGYDDNDRRTQTTFPDSATESKTYDGSGRLTGIEATNAGGDALTEAAYSYDNGGTDSDQLQSKTVNGDTEDYGYDALDRLISDGSVDYVYDDSGNLLSEGTDTFAYNDADQATTARGVELDHDAAGNLIANGERSTDYSVTNQTLVTDEGTSLATSTSYDTADQTQVRGITDVFEGNRIDRQVTNTALGVSNIASEGTRTHYVRDPDGRLVSMIHRDGDQRFNYTTDHQNTVLAITADGSTATEPDVGYTYTPYGRTTTNATEGTSADTLNPFTYTGAYQYQNGTIHLAHRFYDPTINQFTQPDPSRQETNNYTYAQCDPTNRVDPTGLESYAKCVNKAAVGGFFGGAATGAVSGLAGGGVGAIPGAKTGAAIGLAGGAIGGYVTCGY